MAPDRELVRRFRGAENVARAALEDLFRTHYVQLCGIADALTGAPDLSEEIVADVFVWLWEHRNAWNPTTSIEVYLISAVRNKARNLVRDHKTRQELLERTGSIDTFTPASPPAADVTLETAEQTRVLRQVLQSLPPVQRLIITLRWQRQLAWSGVAAALGMSVAAVQMQHTRVMRQLRDRLGEMKS